MKVNQTTMTMETSSDHGMPEFRTYLMKTFEKIRTTMARRSILAKATRAR